MIPSISMRHNARDDIDEAEEEIPEEWGNVFRLLMLREYSCRNGRRQVILSRYPSTRFSKPEYSWPSKRNRCRRFLPARVQLTSVMVTDRERVRLTEGFRGS